MSASDTLIATWTALRRVESRHRFWVWLCVLASAAAVAAISVYGFDYYLLGPHDRPHAIKHALLKPGGTIGIRLGMLGFAVFFLAFLYPIRKHWKWLGRIGKTKHWLDYHIIAGLTAPVIITFHSSFKMGGIAGFAYWIMIAAVLSGLVGRYLYAQIPRHLSAAELSLKELEALSAQLTRQLEAQSSLSPAQMAQLVKPPSAAEVESMSMFAAMLTMAVLDIKHSFELHFLRRRVLADGPKFSGQGRRARREDLDPVIAVLRQQVALSKKIVFYSKAHRIFNLWHVIHRPFPYSFAVLALLHVAVVLSLGYF